MDDFYLKVLGDRSCLWSKQTVDKVDSCPMNKSAVEQRIREKNCDAYAKLQNCTNPLKFLYHCVINEYNNAIIEVCAPVYIINGKLITIFFFDHFYYTLQTKFCKSIYCIIFH